MKFVSESRLFIILCFAYLGNRHFRFVSGYRLFHETPLTYSKVIALFHFRSPITQMLLPLVILKVPENKSLYLIFVIQMLSTKKIPILTNQICGGQEYEYFALFQKGF